MDKTQDEQDVQNMLTLVASEPGWPTLEVPADVYQGRDRKSRNRLDIAAIYGHVKQAFADNELDITVIGHSRAVLLDNGVLELPLLMAQGELGLAVFIYPEGDPVDAGHFAGVQESLQRADFAPPVCYAPSPLPPSRALDPLEPLRIEMFRELENGQSPNGTYAMWWPTDDELLFSTSRTYDYISQFYQALNGVESYFLGHTLDTLGIKQATDIESNRVSLAGKPWILPLLGPELVPVYFVADDTRGIQFYLHAESASLDYRERFWRLMLEMAMRLRRQVEGAGLPMDEYTDEESYPLNWWLLAERSVQLREGQGAQLEYFGGLEALLEDEGNLAPPPQEEQSPQQESPPNSNLVTKVTYTFLVILVVIWTVVAVFALLRQDPPPGTPAEAGMAPDRIQLPADPPETPPLTIQDVPDVPVVTDGAPADSTAAEAATTTVPTPAAETDTETVPPTETAPAEEAPGEEAADQPPAEQVPADEPPADEPPAEQLPEERPEGAPILMRGKAVYPVPLTRPADSIDLTEGANLMLAQERTQARVIDVRRRNVLRTLAGDSNAISHNGNMVASSVNGTSSIGISTIDTGRRLQTVRSVVTPLSYLAFAKDDSVLISWGEEIKVWDVETGEQLASLSTPEGLTEVQPSPDGQHLIAVQDSNLVVYSLPELNQVKRTITGLSGLKSPVFSHSGQQLLLLYDGGIGFFSTDTWQRSRLVVFGAHPKMDLAVNADASIVAIASGANLLSIWQSSTNRWQTFEHPSQALGVFLPDGRSALGVRSDKQVLFWELSGLLAD